MLTIDSHTVGRPQLQHTDSQSSFSASEGFESASSRAHSPESPESNPDSIGPINRMSALSSHPHQHEVQPLHPANAPGVESFQPSTQTTFERLRNSTRDSHRRSDSSQIRRKPVASGNNQISPASSSSSGSNGKVSETVPNPPTAQRSSTTNTSPTPADDTPYIRFALDQLTRDEEVRGSRRYPTQDRWTTAPGATFMPAGPTGRRRSSGANRYNASSGPYVPASSYATAPPTGAFTSSPTGDSYTITAPAPQSRGPTSYAMPVTNPTASTPIVSHRLSSHSINNDDDVGYVTPEEEPRLATIRPIQPTIQPATPIQSRSAEHLRNEVYVPVDQEVPPLRFLPGILRALWLGVYIFLIILVLAGLLFSGIYSSLRLGLFGYTDFGGGRYFIFQYLPLMISMFLLLWLFQIQIAVQRVAPFIAMAANNSKSRSEAPLMEYQPTNFLLPKLFYFRAGQAVIGVAMVIFWLQIFTIPLIACLYNVYYYGAVGFGNWRWLTTQAIVWTLFGLYFLLLVALVVLGIWLWRQRTGLRWDPRSLADVIALLDRSNAFEEYNNSEAFTSHKDFYQGLGLRSDRLGYWTTSNRPESVFYGIAEEGGHTRRYSLERGQLQEKSAHADRSAFSPSTPTTAGLDLDNEDEHDHIRYRYLPWYLRTTWVLLWIVAGILLYLAFLIVSFVNDATLRGFHPLLPVAPTAEGFSSTNFLYSFIPALIAQLIFLSWLSIDYAFRRLQPYAGLSASKRDHMGGSAQQTLLLDYTSRMPISVTLAALKAGDLRVAWFSFLSLITASLPILAGGCFWAQFYVPSQEVRVAVHPPAYYVLCVFLAIFAFSLPLLLFGMNKRRLPHSCTTLADQISWLYASQILGEREWRAPLSSKSEMATRLTTSSTPEERELGHGQFYFGRFVGKDGRTHVGIDRVGRDARDARIPMSQRSWRQNDPSGTLTTPSRGEKTYLAYTAGPSHTPQTMQDTGLTRSSSGRFTPVAAGAGTTVGTANALAPVYDADNSYRDDDRQGLMPRQPPTAVTAPQRYEDGSYAAAPTSRLSESDKPAMAREREARASSNYPSGSSNYPSYTAALQPAGTTFSTAATNPFADPIGQESSTVHRSNTDPKWYERPSQAATAQDSMVDLAESEKPQHARERAMRKDIGSAR